MALTTVPVELANLDGAVTVNESSADVDFRIESNGLSHALFVDGGNDKVIINHTTTVSQAGVAPQFQVHGTGSATSSISATRNSNDTGGPYLILSKSRGTSTGAVTVVQDDDILGQIMFAGADGGDLAPVGASIQAFVDGTPGTDDMPGRLVFSTTADGAQTATERMRIEASGHMGFNTSSIQTFSNYTSYHFGPAGTTSTAFLIDDENGSTGRFQILMAGSGYIGTRSNDALIITTNDSERMRIDTAGAAYFMTTNDMSGDVNVKGTTGVAIGTSASSGYYRRIYTNTSSGASLYFWNGSNQGELNSAGAWVDASDIALKKDVVDIEYGLEVVKKLKPRKYKMKADDSDQIGFVAQEVESEVPEVVSTSENPNGEEQKSLSYGHLTAVLTKAIQEQQTLIETLQTKVKALEEA